ncbi:MAG: hypothetical protein RL333_35 [Pseudomonadota bacterium]
MILMNLRRTSCLAIFLSSLVMTFPGIAHSGVVSYNLADYSSPLTKRVTIPPNWFPSPGAQGYSGALDATWFAVLASDSDQVTLSQGHAIQIGAPRDFTLATGPDNCWGMLMNFGLITLGSTSDLVVSLSADAKQSSSLAPAFALFQGWDTGANSSRHQTITFGSDNPLGSSGLKFIGDAYGNNQSGSVKKTFSNLPAGTYELFVTNRSNSGSYGSYALTLQTFKAGTATLEPANQSDLCGPANNQVNAGEPAQGLCVYGTSTLLPHYEPDGRYLWSCGDAKAVEPMEMCYTLSNRNTKLNQAVLTLSPGHMSVAANTRATETLSGGSGSGAIRYVVAGASSGVKCQLTRKGKNLVVSSRGQQAGTCLIYARKGSSSRFNDVKSIVYRVVFLAP